MSDPNYLILAKQAELYLAGEYGLDKDPSTAGLLTTGLMTPIYTLPTTVA